MRILLINLDRASDRLSHMSAELGRRNLSFERISAIDRVTLSDADIRSVNGGDGGTPLDSGSVACFLSHRKAWEHLIASGDHRACILEDDVVFGEDAAQFLASDRWIPEPIPAGIVRLETFGMRTCWDPDIAFEAFGRSFHLMRRLQWGSAAYVIDRNMARRLLARSKKITTDIDVFLYKADRRGRMPHGPVYQSCPAMFMQANRFARGIGKLPSDISITRSQRTAGTSRFVQRQIVSVKKRWLWISRLALDPLRGERSGIVPFR